MDHAFKIAEDGGYPTIRFADRTLSPIEQFFESSLNTPSLCRALSEDLDAVEADSARVEIIHVDAESLVIRTDRVSLRGARPDGSDGLSISTELARSVMQQWTPLVDQLDAQPWYLGAPSDRPARTDYFLLSPVDNEARRGAAFQIHDRGRSLWVVLNRRAGEWVVQPEFDRALVGITDTDVTAVTRAEFADAVRAFGGSDAAVDRLAQAIADSTVLLRRSGPGPQPWTVMT